VSISCVVLAAGMGKRMNSSTPKVLHRILGTTMLEYVIRAAGSLRPGRTIIVAGKHIDAIKDMVDNKNISFSLQKEPKGTGHALLCARPFVGGAADSIIVLNGDTPLIAPNTLKRFLDLHRRRKDVLSVLSFMASRPDEYGRVVRNDSGDILSIIEDKDADAHQKTIKEVNSGVYAMQPKALDLLEDIAINRLKGEYFLTDIVSKAVESGFRTSAYCIGSEQEFMGVNTREELLRASEILRMRIIRGLTDKGINFLDPGSAFIYPEVTIGRETTIYPNVLIEGRTRIGKNSTIYPNVRIMNSTVGSGVVIKDSSVIEDSTIGDGSSVGPFAHIRPGSRTGKGVKIGNFVELKKSTLGSGSKASHLSYIGDAKIGQEVNIGAGTITCNYDGEKKHITRIGDGVFVGSDTQLIAPVKVGKGAYIGAGSTITKDVPSMALAVSRTEQKNVRGWAKKKKKKSEGGKPKSQK